MLTTNLHFSTFPGEGRGPGEEQRLASVALRSIYLRYWAPAFAGESATTSVTIARHPNRKGAGIAADPSVAATAGHRLGLPGGTPSTSAASWRHAWWPPRTADTKCSVIAGGSMRLAAFGTRPVMASPPGRFPDTCVRPAACPPDPSGDPGGSPASSGNAATAPLPPEGVKDVWTACPLLPVAQRCRVAPGAPAWPSAAPSTGIPCGRRVSGSA